MWLVLAVLALSAIAGVGGSEAAFAEAILDVTRPEALTADVLAEFQRLVEWRRQKPGKEQVGMGVTTNATLMALVDALASSFPGLPSPSLDPDDQEEGTGRKIGVVVVGAGPVGLLSALQLRQHSATHVLWPIVVLERRTEYTRDAWLDVSDNTWYKSLDRLQQWGGTLFASADPHVSSATNIIYRTNMLERLLARIAVLAGGIDLRYGVEPVRILGDDEHGQEDGRSTMTIKRHNDSSTTLLSFDIVVGCEGGSGSWVREQANMTTHVHTSAVFETATAGSVKVTKSRLQQTTVIVRYRANAATQECPTLKNNGDVDPYDITFSHPNISAAFKRWYRGHCQLQLIVRHGYGEQLLEHADRLPWDMLLSVSNALLAHPFRDEANLRAQVLDAYIVPVRIKSTRPLAQALGGRGSRHRSVAVVFGDNAVTAHYRLGIGINQALLALDELRLLLEDAAAAAAASDASPDRVVDVALRQHERASKRVRSMAQYQLRTIVLEAYCGFVMGVNFTEPSLWQSQRVFRANRSPPGSFQEIGRASGGAWGDQVLACLRDV